MYECGDVFLYIFYFSVPCWVSSQRQKLKSPFKDSFFEETESGAGVWWRVKVGSDFFTSRPNVFLIPHLALLRQLSLLLYNSHT
jgi:hypothetical protein